MARARRPRAKLRPDGTCTTCDLTHDPRKCVAHNLRGLPCGRWHIRGGFVCQKHGGASPTTKRKAAARLAEEAAAKFGKGYPGAYVQWVDGATAARRAAKRNG